MENKEKSFEEKIKRLEEISYQIQDSKISIDKASSLYEESLELYVDCKKYLEEKTMSIQVFNEEE